MKEWSLGVAILAAAACFGQPARSGVDAHLSKGTKLMDEQMFAAAAREFEQALVDDENNPDLRFRFAVSLFMQGQNDDARKQFERVQQAGKSPYLTYYLGRLDLLANDYSAAIAKLTTIADKPPYPDTAFHLGVAYASAGDLAEAVKWLERAAKLAPRDYRVHYRLARAYTSSGQEQLAAREYELYSRLLNEHKSTEKLARACTDALHSQPGAASHETCRQMIDPNDPEKLVLLGQLYGDAGAFTEAIEPLQRAVQLDAKSYEAWHNLGVTYFRLGRYTDARQPLQKAVDLRPESFGAVVLLGAALYMLGDDGAALPVLERAHKLNPADAETAAIIEKLKAAHSPTK